MAPDLPPPTRGGVDCAALLGAKLDAKFDFKETQQMFFLQEGIYVVRPCDPLRLGHVLWGKLAFCEFTHRLLINSGKLPEVDPRAILVGMRTSLNALPGKSPFLKSIIERLGLPGEAHAFGFYAKQLGMVGAAKLLLRFVTEDDLLARGMRKSIDEAVQAVSSAARGLLQSDLVKIRSDARTHFGVARACLARTEGVARPLSQVRIQELRRAAEVPVDTSSLPDEKTIREKVLQLSDACVKARNEAALRETLIASCRLQANEVDAARQLIDQHVREALLAPERTASVMTPPELNAVVSFVADRRHVKILTTRWAIDDALARRVLEGARKRGQASNLLVSTTTPEEDEEVRSMLRDPEKNDFHQSVCRQAANQLARFRPGLDPQALQEAVRQLDPQLQKREKQLVKKLDGKPLDEVARRLHDFRDRVVLEQLAARVDSLQKRKRDDFGVKGPLAKLRAWLQPAKS